MQLISPCKRIRYPLQIRSFPPGYRERIPAHISYMISIKAGKVYFLMHIL